MRNSILQNLIKRVERLEARVFGGNSHTPIKPSATKPQTLSTYILDLRAKGQFATPQTPTDVHDMLDGKYHCEEKRVGVELIRLQRKGQLRKASKNVDNKKRVAYVW